MNSKISIRDASMAIALFLICAFFALHPQGGQFLGPQNLSNLSIELAFLKTFLAIQILLLLVIVMNLHKGLLLSLVILGIVVCLVQILTRHTPFGRYLYAIGGNEEAARLSGIPVEKIVIGAYVIPRISHRRRAGTFK